MTSLEANKSKNSNLESSFRSRRHGALINSTALSLLLATGLMSGVANAQELTVHDEQTLSSESFAGIDVISGGSLTGNDLTILQSTNNTGLLVTKGEALLSGGTITQTNATSSARGVRVLEGFASVNDLTINVDGKSGVSGLSADGNNSSAFGDEITVNLSAAGSTTGSPSASVYATNGATISTTGSTFISAGKNAYGLLASGNKGVVNIVSQNDTISTTGESGWGVFAFSDYEGEGSGIITIADGGVSTEGLYGYALLSQEAGSIINASNLSINTIGEWGLGAYASYGGHVDISDTSINTSGNSASGFYSHLSTVEASNVSISTEGASAYGARALEGRITINNSSIATIGSKAHGLFATGADGSITADNTTINTSESWTFGAYAKANGTIVLNGGAINTTGERGYGILSATGGTVTSSADITTTGLKAHGVQAGEDAANREGTVNLTGGTIKTSGSDAFGLHSVFGGSISATGNVTVMTTGTNGFGAFAESDSRILLDGTAIRTSGTGGFGLVANNDKATVGGIIAANDVNVIVAGESTEAARAEKGGAISISNSYLESSNAAGIRLLDNATVTLNETTLVSAQETFVSQLDQAGKTQHIALGQGTVATQNNGTLLRVNRSADGADGVVQLTLGAGSTTQGDIIDVDTKSSGGTDVTLEEGANWAGLLHGVRNFFGFQGGSVDFEGEANIAGNLNGTGTSYSFSSQGGTIGGDVNLAGGSSTTGGSIDNRIVVGGDVNVDDTSILGGNWRIGGNLGSSGTLSPGNSIGRVDIGGNLNLTPSSVYQVDVDLSGDADLVTVAGTAYLDGIVTVTPMDGYKLASPYTILTAGAIDGQFQSASLAEPSAFLDTSLAQSATDVTLTVERNSTSFSSIAQTANQVGVANAIDQLPLSHGVAGAIALSSVEDAREAFHHLSGDANASVKTGLIETAHLTADAINNRLRSAFEGVGAKAMPVLSFAQSAKTGAGAAIDDASIAQPSYNYAFWATGFGSWIDHDGNSNAGGLKTSTGGFLSGLDVGFASGWRVGLVGGYSEADLDAKGRYASATSDNWHLGVYGGNQWGALGLRAGLIHTWHGVDSSRSTFYAGYGDSLTADYDARTLQAFGEVGYRIDVAPVSLEPFANLSHIRLRTDGYTEKGGASALTVESETTNTTFTTLGVRASTPLQLGATTANLKGTIGWRHAYGDITPESTQAFIGGTAFTVQGAPIAKDAALLEAGFDVAITETSTFGLSYVGQFGNGTTQNGFNASFNVKF
ncbi:hypothetical protein DKP76_18315 [Falsochrobactrum shanghaiense]|uniref:Autotransporter domain-containing protein n=1 Tax=Falsochrobactrum shanghaiense TaxID=2201899 RepID=A0A316J4M9_9HYPH|nr:autotransporter domain-containing protein [Falsochrobactrum shanghaiense]PWL16291.1 hypothetical protein DKP76_18315 [Falsochrobactrum shanghaiense]